LRRMKIESSNGARLSLQPVAYQFGTSDSKVGSKDWDANWLIIRGELRGSDGREWSFSDPCLTTWEAASLAAWLHGVVDGVVVPVAAEDLSDTALEIFTEPNIALSLAARNGEQVRVRFHLSLEAIPPWFGDDDRPDLFEYFVPLDTSIDELARAADDWERELAPFPER
ncbi:MAG: hypothetical protein JWO36_911, partial [Myxococcales bacterium]|nr:hypothetical protein [Myxococcales bacterium]